MSRLLGIVVGLLLTIANAHAITVDWSRAPNYSSREIGVPFTIPDPSGDRVMYSASYAVLVIQGEYGGSWSPATAGAATSERLMVKALEARGFHVLVWRNLTNREFRSVLPEVFETYGDAANARFFFYYYGHATTVGHPDEPGGVKLYLVPTDAPPAHDPAFKRGAVPASQLKALVENMGVKHAFFALEACKAGALIGSLGDPPKVNDLGYLYSAALQAPVRQYLTAGNEFQNIPADAAFSALLVGALSSAQADSNDDGYITGNEVISFVKGNLPQYRDYPQDPEYAIMPPGSSGDLIFGAVDPGQPRAIPIPVPVIRPERASIPPLVDASAFPRFVGKAYATDIGNRKFIAFLLGNFGRDVYLDLWLVQDMNGANYGLLKSCSMLDATDNLMAASSGTGEYRDWAGDDGPDVNILPTMSEDSKFSNLQSVWQLEGSDYDRLADGTMSAEIDCGPELYIKTLEEPDYMAGGTGLARFHYKGVYALDLTYSGGQSIYTMEERDVPSAWLIQLQAVGPQATLNE